MVVVADTSPINYLVLIEQIDLLTRLYTRILIPPAVLAERSIRSHRNRFETGPAILRSGWKFLVRKTVRLSHSLIWEKLRRSLSQLKCMPRYYLLMSRPDGRKQFAEG